MAAWSSRESTFFVGLGAGFTRRNEPRAAANPLPRATPFPLALLDKWKAIRSRDHRL